jgi:hypothetical protein
MLKTKSGIYLLLIAFCGLLGISGIFSFSIFSPAALGVIWGDTQLASLGTSATDVTPAKPTATNLKCEEQKDAYKRPMKQQCMITDSKGSKKCTCVPKEKLSKQCQDKSGETINPYVDKPECKIVCHGAESACVPAGAKASTDGSGTGGDKDKGITDPGSESSDDDNGSGATADQNSTAFDDNSTAREVEELRQRYNAGEQLTGAEEAKLAKGFLKTLSPAEQQRYLNLSEMADNSPNGLPYAEGQEMQNYTKRYNDWLKTGKVIMSDAPTTPRIKPGDVTASIAPIPTTGGQSGQQAVPVPTTGGQSGQQAVPVPTTGGQSGQQAVPVPVPATGGQQFAGQNPAIPTSVQPGSGSMQNTPPSTYAYGGNQRPQGVGSGYGNYSGSGVTSGGGLSGTIQAFQDWARANIVPQNNSFGNNEEDDDGTGSVTGVPREYLGTGARADLGLPPITTTPTVIEESTFYIDGIGEISVTGASREEVEQILAGVVNGGVRVHSGAPAAEDPEIAGASEDGEILFDVDNSEEVAGATGEIAEIIYSAQTGGREVPEWLQTAAGDAVALPHSSGGYGYIVSSDNRSVDIYTERTGKVAVLEVDENGEMQVGIARKNGETTYMPDAAEDPFESWAEFTEAFREITGVTPTEFAGETYGNIEFSELDFAAYEVLVREIYGEDALKNGIPFSPENPAYTETKYGKFVPTIVLDEAMQPVKDAAGVTDLEKQIFEISRGAVVVTSRGSALPVSVVTDPSTVRIMPINQQVLTLTHIKKTLIERGAPNVDYIMRTALFNTYDTNLKKAAGLTAYTVRIDENGSPLGRPRTALRFSDLFADIFAEAGTLVSDAAQEVTNPVLQFIRGVAGGGVPQKAPQQSGLQALGEIITAPLKLVGNMISSFFGR